MIGAVDWFLITPISDQLLIFFLQMFYSFKFLLFTIHIFLAMNVSHDWHEIEILSEKMNKKTYAKFAKERFWQTQFSIDYFMDVLCWWRSVPLSVKYFSCFLFHFTKKIQIVTFRNLLLSIGFCWYNLTKKTFSFACECANQIWIHMNGCLFFPRYRQLQIFSR